MKKMLHYTFLSISMAIMYSNAQSINNTIANSTITTTTNNNNPIPLDKPADLPKVEWNILQMDPSSRENLCQRQIAYCSNNCGGPTQVSKNFCNTTSMAWGCSCSGTVSDFTPFLWPIVQAECSGKAQDCQMICNKDKVHPSACAATCNTYYQCGTDKAPPSFLQTENPTDIPISYDGPKKIVSASDQPSDGSRSTGRHGFSADSNLTIAVFITLLLCSLIS